MKFMLHTPDRVLWACLRAFPLGLGLGLLAIYWDGWK